MEDQNLNSSIEIKLTSKGKYHWNIKLAFDSKTILNPKFKISKSAKIEPEKLNNPVIAVAELDNSTITPMDVTPPVILALKNLDKQLRKEFAHNYAEIPLQGNNKMRFHGLEDEDEDDPS